MTMANAPMDTPETEAEGLDLRISTAATASALAALGERSSQVPAAAAWETTNLHQVATLLTHVAALREETRGGHVRGDFPHLDDEHWRGHLTTRLDEDGALVTSYAPVREQVVAT